MQIKTKIVICHTVDSKPVKQKVKGTVILPHLEFPGFYNTLPIFQRSHLETNVTGVDWIPVELELVDKIWLPDTEILRLKGFHSLSVLGRLQV